MELAPGVIVGDHFRLDSLLGVGGMGAVWKATDVSLGRPVAIKVLHHDLRSDPQLNERFAREARLLASIDHPAIVPIYAWITLEDAGRQCPAIVMPFVRGESLADALRRRRTIPVDESITMMRQLLDALRAAHDAGIVHRDLKPQNVMLEDRGGGVVNVRLLDFGVAKSLLTASTQASMVATQAGMIIGTPEYMSPEQISDPTRVDARADLWAVGVTLFEMLTGQLPFPGATPVETISRVLTAPPMPASSFNPTLPPTLDAFFKRTLSRSIDDRPRSAAEMLQAIEALVPAVTRLAPQSNFPWPPASNSQRPGPGLPQTTAQPAYYSQPGTPAPVQQSGYSHGGPTPFPQPQQQQPQSFGGQPQFGAPSPFAQPTPAQPPIGVPYVPPPSGLAPFPSGSSSQEETEKKIALYTIVGIAITCIAGILGVALFQTC